MNPLSNEGLFLGKEEKVFPIGIGKSEEGIRFRTEWAFDRGQSH